MSTRVPPQHAIAAAHQPSKPPHVRAIAGPGPPLRIERTGAPIKPSARQRRGSEEPTGRSSRIPDPHHPRPKQIGFGARRARQADSQPRGEGATGATPPKKWGVIICCFWIRIEWIPEIENRSGACGLNRRCWALERAPLGADWGAMHGSPGPTEGGI